MKKYFASAALLLLAGAGCASSEPVSTVIEGDIRDVAIEEEGGEVASNDGGGRVADPVAFPSGTYEMYRTAGYALPIDQEFQPEQSGDYLRLQNFVGQDDPNYDYADDAFLIEITYSPVADFAIEGDYGTVTEVDLAGETVSKGTERVVRGDGWPGHGYYNRERDVYIVVAYLHPEGAEIAEAVLSHLSWE